MVNIYSVILLVLELVPLFCYVKVGQKRSEYTTSLRQVYVAGMGALLFNVLFMQAPNQWLATFFDSVYYICIDWILLFMIQFAVLYTNTQISAFLHKYLFGGLVAMDSVSLLLNDVTGHMFTVRREDYNGLSYWSADFTSLHYLHLGICYLMSLFVVVILARRIVRSPKPYRKMYVSILGAFALVLVVNAVCYFFQSPIDLSLLFYVYLGVALCYFLVYASPKGLVESILANVVEDFDNAIVCFDFSGKCIYVNTNARKLLDLKDDKLNSVKDTFYVNWISSHAPDSVDYEYWDKEFSVDGESHHFHIEFQRLKGRENTTIGFFYKLIDKTAEIKAFQEGRYLATHDRLTGLYNRDYFFQKAEEIIRRNPDKERYMVCASIRNFQMMSELFGEEMGDKILVAQAALLKFTNFEDCIQGRISSDKFAMLITKDNFNAEMTVKNMGRLQYMIDGRNYKLNIGIGVYNITDCQESPQEMFEKACMAVETQVGNYDYQKTVVYYDTKLLQQIMKERDMADEFENALKTRQFRMFLQPQMDVDGRVVGAEALARWQHPQRGLIFPVDFLSVVEKTRLISRLDEYMWELAAEKLKQWKEEGFGEAQISVNISAKDFYYIDIYETLVNIINKYGIDPARMNLEISETELLSETAPQIKELNRLQDFGFSIQIDDFGKGYSSLNMLQTIRADLMKIDMRLLGEIPDPVKMRKILNAIITMAGSLDMEVITESVETEEQVKMLTELGCTKFQGYYFSKPISVEEFEEKFLRANG